MKVKEMIEKLSKFDENKEILIRYKVSNKDLFGYILKPESIYETIETAVIYGNYSTDEDCSYIGQKDLKKLWEEGK